MRWLLAAVLATGLVLGGAGAAGACSCMALPADELVATGDAAVVGTVVAVDGSVDEGRRFRVEVEEVARSMVPATVAVRSVPGDSAACGLDAAVGQRVGWVLRDDDGWVVDLCSQVDPDELAALPGARPVATPSPDPADPPELDRSPLFPLGAAVVAVGLVLGAVVWLDRR